MNEDILKKIVEPLLHWYHQNRRILPWRENPTAYHVWVSEIMLQQTRVEAVKEYYQRFLQQFPDVSSLANASEDELLKAWEGLGYYSRVRNMQKAARILMDQFNGEFPMDETQLRYLPGIGDYTTGAIGSIALGLPLPAVDGNVLRVFTRLTKDHRDIGKDSVKREVRNKLAQVIPHNIPGDFNQAWMELGATVCLPNGAPLCSLCPLSDVCLSNLDGTKMDYPYKAPKKERKVEERTVFVLVAGHSVALRKRPDTGLLSRLWEFPSVHGFLAEPQLTQELCTMGLTPRIIVPLPKAKHIFTHVEWHMQGYLIEVDEQQSSFSWANIGDLQNIYAIPSAFRVYLKEAQKRLI